MGQSKSGNPGQHNPNNPPNPNRGRSMVPVNHALKYTEEDMRSFLKRAEQFARNKLLAELGITDLNTGHTPSSSRFDENGEDQFPELVNRDRASLCLGDLNDEEMANLVFMQGDIDKETDLRLSLAALQSGRTYYSKLAAVTGGKERIRWLSRHLEQALNETRLQRNAAWDFLMEEHGSRGEDAIRQMANQLLLPKEFVDGKFNKMKGDNHE